MAGTLIQLDPTSQTTVVATGNVVATSVDGGLVPLGSTTDTLWTGTGPATVIAALKAAYSKLTSIVSLLSNNVSITAITSGSRTTTQTSTDITNTNGRYLHVILDVTAIGTGSVTLTINGKDATSNKYYPLLVGAAITTNSTNVYRVGPAFAPSVNATANDMIPAILQIVVNANNANAATYSVGYNIGGN